MNKKLLSSLLACSLLIPAAWAEKATFKDLQNEFTYLGIRGGRGTLDSDTIDSRVDITYDCYYSPGYYHACYRDEDDDTAFYSVFGGRKIPDTPFRVELEYTYNTVLDMLDRNGTPMEVKTRRTMLNGYYDHEASDRMFLHIGLGAGMAKNTITGDNGYALNGDNGSQFAYALGVGANWRAMPRLDLEMGFRYVWLGDANYTDVNGYNVSDDMNSRELYIGARIRF
jgi:opacity protein-like surface antigen